MKRVVSSSIISLVILLLIAGGFFYWQFLKNDAGEAYDAVPSDVAFVISVDPTSGELQRLAKSSFFNGSDSVPVLKSWQAALLDFNNACLNNARLKEVFASSPLLISGHVTGPSAFSLLFVMPANAELSASSEEVIATVLKKKGAVQSRNYNGVEIKEMIMDEGRSFSWAISRGVLIGSTTPYLVEDALRQQRNDEAPSPANELKAFINGKPREMVYAVHYTGFAKWLKTQFKDPASVRLNGLDRLGSWSVMRLDLHANIISFNGETLTGDTTAFLNLFQNQQPVQRKLIDWLPAKTAAAVIWGASDAAGFLNGLKDYRKQIKEQNNAATILPYFRDWIGEEMALVVTQPAGSLTDNNYMAMLSVKDAAKAASQLAALAGNTDNKEEYYNGYTIRVIDRKSVMQDLLGSLFFRVNKFFYTSVNSHIVIANQASVLRAYINDVKTGNLLVKQDRYQSLAAQVPAKGNLFFYCSIPQSERLFSSIAAPAWVKWLAEYGEVLNNWNGLTFSVSRQQGLFTTTGCLGYFNASARGPQLAWNTKLDTTLTAGPFLPSPSSGLIFAGDAAQQLYAFDESGSLRWKKKLETPLMSKVEAVDFYKNGAVQYLFSTHSFVYLVDSAGNNVGSYPFRLPAEASAGLTFVQGDAARDARFYIPCKNLRLFAYDISGKPLPGFAPMKLPDVVVQPICMLKENSEMAVLVEKGVCFIASITGERKYTIKGTVAPDSGTALSPLPGSVGLFSYRSENKMRLVAEGGEQQEMELNGSENYFDIAFGDVNGDSVPDKLIAANNGFRVETLDGLTLFRFKSDEQFSGTAFHQVSTVSFISAVSAGRCYLFNRDGSLYEGFPLSGYTVPLISEGSEGEKIILLRSGDDNFSLYQLP